jgi:HD-GYP domain-containing protein (c-di-GMP phosphodiesterase class II)
MIEKSPGFVRPMAMLPISGERVAERIPQCRYFPRSRRPVYFALIPFRLRGQILASQSLEVSLVDRVIVGLPPSTFDTLPFPRRLVETCVASVCEAEEARDPRRIIDWLDLHAAADALLICLREVLHARSLSSVRSDEAAEIVHRAIAEVAREHCRKRAIRYQITDAARHTSDCLIAGLRNYDPSLAADSESVGYYAQRFAAFLELTDIQRGRIGLCGLLHNIGKFGMSPVILQNCAQLEPDEWEVYRTYPAAGARTLSRYHDLSPIAPLVAQHCEHLDGSGYPSGTFEIPIESQIVGILAAWRSLTTNRPHRSRIGPWEAYDAIARHAGTRYDQQLVESFGQLLGLNPELTSDPTMRAA